MGEYLREKEDLDNLGLISIKGRKEHVPDRNPERSPLPNIDDSYSQSIHRRSDDLKKGQERQLFSDEFYQKKISQLNQELEQSHRVLADFKKVIKKQKEEIEKKSDFEKEKEKILKELEKESGKNRELKLDFKHLVNEHEKDIVKRDNIIKQLYEETELLKKEVKEENTKAKLYEKISLEAKNDSLTFYEKFNEASKQVKQEKEKSVRAEHKRYLAETEFAKLQKHMDIIKEEYDQRVQRIKQKHEEEIKELISNHTKTEMALKSQIYSLSEQYEEFQKNIARENKSKQELAEELRHKMSLFITPQTEIDGFQGLDDSDDEIIYNVPKNMDDYDHD